MIVNSQEAKPWEGWDGTQFLSVSDGPRAPDLTIGVLMGLTSSKNFAEIARRLKREDAAKLADDFNQVCHVDLRDALIRLTTAAMTRQSDPSI